ncbi:hypothetical protein [Gemella sp. zg-1178]|uniref:hypothetical protein n=1 Tax=Gemella sp. zg-1178 TaxID=2840372 RepID=UPI001C03DD50|nr:hypothetical protein [Gemella sp. zg-1178]MBU0279387.1 hypothetical protein [Gemella sp. zg-1178]
MNKKFKFTSAILASSLLITPISALVSNYDNVAKAENFKKKNIKLSEEDIRYLETFFNQIEKIPEDLLLNGNSKEIKNYLIKNKIPLNIYNDNIGETKDSIFIIQPRGFWGCVGSLGTLIVSTAVPAAKILKIKKYVKHLGGVTDAVRYLLGIKGAESGGAVLKSLILELSGIASVTESCFS